jgi:hypothetical protein
MQFCKLIVVSSRILDLLLLVEVDLGADFLGFVFFFFLGGASL